MGARILLVEDELLTAMDLEEVLAEEGYQVIGPAASVAEAREMARAETPDVALLDVNLPDGHVYPVAAKLESMGVPVVLMTGHSRQGIEREFRDLPLVSKPYRRELLLQALDNALAGKSGDRGTL